jgi:hypothetical protein
VFDLRRTFNAHRRFGMPADADGDPVGEWLTVDEVAAWLKVSRHHVYKTIAKLPGCEPLNVSGTDRRKDFRFNRHKLAAALAAPRSR